jgi:hypothetical protein
MQPDDADLQRWQPAGKFAQKHFPVEAAGLMPERSRFLYLPAIGVEEVAGIVRRK